MVFPSGSFDQCVSGFGVFDMSGNVFEWASCSGGWRNLGFGGYFESKEFGASCDYGFFTVITPMSHSGFRCCVRLPLHR